MIVVRNITDKMHEDELKELIYSYYDEIYGGVFSKIPFKAVRDYFTGSKAFARADLNDLYNKETNSKAIGIYIGLYMLLQMVSSYSMVFVNFISRYVE